MKKYNDTHEVTLELPNSGNEVTFTVTGTYYPADPGRTYGRPEDCYPPEPSEFSIHEIDPPIPSSEDEEVIEELLTEKCLELSDAESYRGYDHLEPQNDDL
jgi:hypothetical protein